MTEVAYYNNGIQDFGNLAKYMRYEGLYFGIHKCYGNLESSNGDRKCIVCGRIYKETK